MSPRQRRRANAKYLHVRPGGKSRAAPYRRATHRPPQALLGGDRRQGRQARYLQEHARAAARLRSPTSGDRVGPDRTISYERVEDYWGKGPAGQRRARTISTKSAIEYFRDDTVELEGFKGDEFDWREETRRASGRPNTISRRSTKGVVREILEQPYRSAGLDGRLRLNLRRDTFKDVRVRQAFDLTFAFDEINKRLFYGQYTGSTVSSLERRSPLRVCRRDASSRSSRGERQGAAGGIHARRMRTRSAIRRKAA